MKIINYTLLFFILQRGMAYIKVFSHQISFLSFSQMSSSTWPRPLSMVATPPATARLFFYETATTGTADVFFPSYLLGFVFKAISFLELIWHHFLCWCQILPLCHSEIQSKPAGRHAVCVKVKSCTAALSRPKYTQCDLQSVSSEFLFTAWPSPERKVLG